MISVSTPATSSQFQRKPIPTGRATTKTKISSTRCQVNDYDSLPLDENDHEDVETTQAEGSAGAHCSIASHETVTNRNTCVQISTYVQRARNTIRRFWLWEAAACLYDLACLAAILIVLMYENGKELDQWGLFLSPTVVVSFMATMTKAAFVLVLSEILSQLKWLHYQTPNPIAHIRTFDSASRGPWGSIILIWSSKRWVASLAAILMVCSLLVDPFVQLVFSFPNELVVDHSQISTFLQSNIFDPIKTDDGFVAMYTDTYPAYSPPYMIVDITLSTEIMASISNGFSSTNSTIQVTCPSGNCTWPTPITSLGICGGCRNVTASVTNNCSETYNANMNATILQCTYTFVNFPAPENQLSTSDVSMLATMDNSSRLSSWLWASTVIEDQSSPEATIVQFLALQNTKKASVIEEIPSITAWDCSLAWCAKTYNNVTVVDAVPIVAEPATQTLYYKLTENNTKTVALSPYSDNIQFSGKFPYHVDLQAYGAITDQLTSVFSVVYASWYTLTWGGTDPNLLIGDTLIPYTLSQSSDLDVTIRNLATSLTETIRTGRNSTPVAGNSLVPKAIIRVRWAWLALPLALLLSTCALLLAVAIRSHRAKAVVWKDDPLPLLLSTVKGIDISLLDNPKTGPEDLANISKELYIKSTPGLPFGFTRDSRKI